MRRANDVAPPRHALDNKNSPVHVAGRDRSGMHEPMTRLASPPVLATDVVDRWLGASWEEIGAIALSTVVIFLAIITYTRLVGLRSFSKMSSFDFAMTVAVGSLMASTAVSSSTSLIGALVGLGLLYLVQVVIALARVHLDAERLVDNTPLLLVADGVVLEPNLQRSRVTRDDLRAKLRQQGITSWSDVTAVVLETTGDVSVLTGDVDPELVENVRRT